MSNLRNNLRVRKLTRDIIETQSEIDSYDMEEAARAKRVFQERYKVEKDRETEMQSKVWITSTYYHHITSISVTVRSSRRRAQLLRHTVEAARGRFEGVQGHQ